MSTTEIQRIYDTMEYGPAPESREAVDQWLATHAHKMKLFINGQWQDPSDGQYFDVNNPASGEKLTSVAEASQKDVNQAVTAAKAALPVWEGIGAHGRARYLYAIARQIQKHARLFSVLESLDNGKPIRESRDIDIPLVARHFYHHAGWAQLMPTEMPDYEALGVIGQIIPWNFPLLMLAWKIAPALAMGNTVVLKPAEYTPLTAILFAEICEKIQLPPGVVNIVTGDGKTGEMIVQHPDVAKIAFTGSTDVGKHIRKAIAGTGKKLSLELGGKSPFIVFEDSDLDSAVEGLIDAIWFNQGQVCCAGSRLLVQESVADTLIHKIKQRLEKFRLGSPLDKSIDMGTIVDPIQLERIEALVKEGEQEGATMWQPSCKMPSEGCFFPPTLFTDVSPAHTLAQREIFGPVLVSMTFRTPSEAVSLANNTRYGLAASVWTENINLALDIAPQIKAGIVWVNSTNVFDAAAGFGGYRESGFGREGGREGLWEYVKPRWLAKLHDLPEMPAAPEAPETPAKTSDMPKVDCTAKLYIGGKQTRPDGGYSDVVYNEKHQAIDEVARGNRKDIRNAVEAAHKGKAWSAMTAHARAQVLYFIAENLSKRAKEFAARITECTDNTTKQAELEVETCIERLFTYAAYADKYDGHVHHTPLRNVTLAMPEPVGVMGVVCPTEISLLGFISTVIPPLAMGNTVIAIPSDRYPLLATDFYQILETSDLPAGALNIVTGSQDALAEVLANHDNVDGLWYFGGKAGCKMIEYAAAENMKRTWLHYGKAFNWLDAKQGEGAIFLRHATEIKNIWVPYGE
jgi:aldehyde dehydrogenase (NAD+)